MRLTQRLLVGSLIVGSILVIFIVAIATRRLEPRLLEPAVRQLERDARIVAAAWAAGADADSLADVWTATLGRRVTLVAADGRVLGDGEFDGAALARLESHADREEIAAALRGEPASAMRVRPEGPEYLFVAVRAPGGAVRIGQPTSELRRIATGARTDVLIAGMLALVFAMGIAALFAVSISRPIVELRDVAQAFAAGDVTRRPTLAAPGEIGDLATALYRMAGQLSQRFEALEREEATLRALIESLNEGIVAVDARRRIVRINESGRRLLGVGGRGSLTVDHLPRERVLREALDAALDGVLTDGIEVRVDDRVLLLTARPLPEGSAVLAFYDLTPVRRLETVRRDFVANVSHELRTPLTVIGGFAETLAARDVDEEHRRQFAETIRISARRMQRIVDDLLDLSRIESGGWIPAPTTVDVRTFAADALAAVREAAEAKGLVLEASVAPGAEQVHADHTALRQVLGNLVENAVRYTGAGGRVTLFSEAAPEGVWVGVRDTGVGIPAEHLPRIFERFYRVDASRSREEGGTGLGLSIVRHLVEAHGGRIRAESTPGRGTTIACLFPASRSD